MQKDDPLGWDQQVSSLAQYDARYRRLLRTDPESADPSGPFVGVPAITERAGFVRLRELREDHPLRGPLLRWAYRLADSRVNTDGSIRAARFWHFESIQLQAPRATSLTRSRILIEALREPLGRAAWLSALGDHLRGAADWISERWQRRDELAKRAGFEGTLAVIDPAEDMPARVESWLAITRSMATDVLPRELLPSFEVALATGASKGWPSRLTAPTMARLLGEGHWLERAPVGEPAWPSLLGPTSFARGLYRLGREIGRAWAPRDVPYVLGHDPWNLEQHRFGSLVASLVLNPDWHRRVLGLNKEHAESQVRELTRAWLFQSRCQCLGFALRRAAIESPQALTRAFAEHTTALFGVEWPPPFAGCLPRLRFDAAQRLLGMWFGLADQARLVQAFDQDWYRNPRALEALHGQAHEVTRLTPSTSAIVESIETVARSLADGLS